MAVKYCYGTLFAPFLRTATWSSINTAVATVNASGLATAQSPGSTRIQATWTVTTYAERPDGLGCQRVTYHPIAEAICDVFRPVVIFKTAQIGGTTATFNNNIRKAVLNLPSGALADQICHDFRTFTCTVSFDLPNDAIGLSDSRSSVRGIDAGPDAHTDNHDWFINGFSFANVNLTSSPKRGQMLISMHRRTSGAAEAPSISITVAGDYGTGTFSTTETLTINCP